MGKILLFNLPSKKFKIWRDTFFFFFFFFFFFQKKKRRKKKKKKKKKKIPLKNYRYLYTAMETRVRPFGAKCSFSDRQPGPALLCDVFDFGLTCRRTSRQSSVQ